MKPPLSLVTDPNCSPHPSYLRDANRHYVARAVGLDECDIKALAAVRDVVNSSERSAEERIRLRRALDQIGFALAGTEHDHISKRCLAVLNGETFDGLTIQPHHAV